MEPEAGVDLRASAKFLWRTQSGHARGTYSSRVQQLDQVNAIARLAGYLTDLVSPVSAMKGVKPDDARIAALLLGTRLPSRSGGPIAYVNANRSQNAA